MDERDGLDWLYGRKFQKTSIFGWRIRSHTMTVTTLEAIVAELQGQTARLGAAGHADLTLSNPPAPTRITNRATGLQLSIGQIINMKSWELIELRIDNGVTFVDIGPFQTTIHDYVGGVDDLEEHVVGNLESKFRNVGRQLINVRQYIPLVPWALVGFMSVVFVELIRSGQSLSVILLGLGGLILAGIASGSAMSILKVKYRDVMPKPVVVPVRWSDLVANRVKVGLTIAGIVAGIVGTLAAVFVAAALSTPSAPPLP